VCECMCVCVCVCVCECREGEGAVITHFYYNSNLNKIRNVCVLYSIIRDYSIYAQFYRRGKMEDFSSHPSVFNFALKVLKEMTFFSFEGSICSTKCQRQALLLANGW
jgi:hypothetical protein